MKIADNPPDRPPDLGWVENIRDGARALVISISPGSNWGIHLEAIFMDENQSMIGELSLNNLTMAESGWVIESPHLARFLAETMHRPEDDIP
jgi:hypothetical protein